MADYLTRAEMQEMRNQHDGMFTPGSLFTTAVVPGLAELYAEKRLSGRNPLQSRRSILPKSILGVDVSKEMMKKAGGVKAVPLGPGIGEKFERQIRQSVRLRQFARGVGMAEIIKLGADLGGMAVDAVMSYRSAPKDIKLSTGPGFFSDTRAAQTQRQRAIQAIHNSQLTTRAALGNEAAFLHI